MIKNFKTTSTYKEVLNNIEEYVPCLGEHKPQFDQAIRDVDDTEAFYKVFFDGARLSIVTDTASDTLIFRSLLLLPIALGLTNSFTLEEKQFLAALRFLGTGSLKRHNLLFSTSTYKTRFIDLQNALSYTDDFGNKDATVRMHIANIYNYMFNNPDAIKAEANEAFVNLKNMLQSNYIRQAEEEVNTITHAIETLEHDLSRHYIQQREARIKLLGAKSLLDQEENPIDIMFDYIKMLKIKGTLDYEAVSNDTVSFEATVPLNKFDIDLATSYFNNDRNSQDILYELKDLFIGDKGRLLITTSFKLVSFTSVRKHYDTLTLKYRHKLPQPHIMGFDCWGNYANEITKLFAQTKYQEGFATVLSACGSLNFLDGAVMNKFKTFLNEALEDTQCKCVKLADGELLSLQEFIDRNNAPVELPLIDVLEGEEVNE